MRKVFPLAVAGKDPLRVFELVKRDVRKYLDRERRKVLPEGVDFWDFSCAVGPSRSAPAATHVGDIGKELDKAFEAKWPEVYVEILAKPGHRTKKPVPVPGSDE
jgi:hypothetical protein